MQWCFMKNIENSKNRYSINFCLVLMIMTVIINWYFTIGVSKKYSCKHKGSQVVMTPLVHLCAWVGPTLTAESPALSTPWCSSTSPVLDSSPPLTGSEGYSEYPAQVPSGNSQLARAASNPLQRPRVQGNGGRFCLLVSRITHVELSLHGFTY